MTTAGWYPDPMGLWDERWWDGVAWHDAVRTDAFAWTEPLTTLDALLATPLPGGALWTSERDANVVHKEHYVLLATELQILLANGTPERVVPLFGIAWARARVNAGQALRGVGDIELHIAYPGYTGRATEVLRSVPDCELGAALITRQARLNRHLQAHRPPPPPAR